jgi:hypothetical protein
MPERAINTKSATGCMLVLIPAALTMSALFVAWPVILGVTLAIAGGNIWQSYEWTKTARSIDPVFQQLIIQNRGEISALDLSLRANVPGKVSERYLVAKAGEFGTGRRQHPDRGQVYYFVSVSTLGQIFDDSELETPAIMPATNPVAAFEPKIAQPEPILVSLSDNPVVATAALAMPLEEKTTFPPVVTSTPVPEPSQLTELPDETAVESNHITQVPAETVVESNSLTQVPDETAVDSSQIAQMIDETAVAATDTVSKDLQQMPLAEVHADIPPTSPLVLIIQSELAKRLDVHSSTIYKRRSEPNFTDWTRNRDPEGIAWGYEEATKEYYRIDS